MKQINYARQRRCKIVVDRIQAQVLTCLGVGSADVVCLPEGKCLNLDMSLESDMIVIDAVDRKG